MDNEVTDTPALPTLAEELGNMISNSDNSPTTQEQCPLTETQEESDLKKETTQKNKTEPNPSNPIETKVEKEQDKQNQEQVTQNCNTEDAKSNTSPQRETKEKDKVQTIINETQNEIMSGKNDTDVPDNCEQSKSMSVDENSVNEGRIKGYNTLQNDINSNDLNSETNETTQVNTIKTGPDNNSLNNLILRNNNENSFCNNFHNNNDDDNLLNKKYKSPGNNHDYKRPKK
jgi:hypothetical protein